MLLTETDKDAAVPIAESLRGIIERTRVFSDDSRLTISVGVSSFPTDGADPAALVQAADRALYQAKAAGRNASKPPNGLWQTANTVWEGKSRSNRLPVLGARRRPPGSQRDATRHNSTPPVQQNITNCADFCPPTGVTCRSP